MVMEINPLAGSLVDALVSVENEAMSERREQLVTDLLLEEIGRLQERPLGLPFPRDEKLAAPVLLLPSIQVNIRAGRFPKAEQNGVHYLVIPVRPRSGAEAVVN